MGMENAAHKIEITEEPIPKEIESQKVQIKVDSSQEETTRIQLTPDKIATPQDIDEEKNKAAAEIQTAEKNPFDKEIHDLPAMEVVFPHVKKEKIKDPFAGPDDGIGEEKAKSEIVMDAAQNIAEEIIKLVDSQ